MTRLAHRRVRRHPGAAALGALCVLLACLATTTAQVHAQAAGEAARAQALASQDPRIVVRGPTSPGSPRPTGPWPASPPASPDLGSSGG
ncbi:hypothetical protein [Mobilicoccus caccae]|uniref:hypothetical protein n=1 Tax=Mobilicoccus caccae TaxID=1859295 RepID=UPI0024E0B190|nr:hypothetical protein [Mobilicoccus caccae]